MNVSKRQPMSFWSNSQYFPRSRTSLFTKENGVLSYICRTISEVTSHRTTRHSQKVRIHATERQIPPQSRIALTNGPFPAKLTENNKIKLEECLSRVKRNVITSRQARGAYSANYGKRVISSTFNVNVSESEASFPLQLRHFSASVAHYKLR